VHITQKTDYPFSGNIQITLIPEQAASFPLFIRIPEWSKTAVITVNGKPVEENRIITGTYCKIDRLWKANDIVEIQFPYELKIIYRSEVADAPQGGKSMYNVDWFTLTQGPLVYATDGLIFGTEREEVISLPETNPESVFTKVASTYGSPENVFELRIPDKKPILFKPFYSAGERKEGTWRLTWVQKKIN